MTKIIPNCALIVLLFVAVVFVASVTSTDFFIAIWFALIGGCVALLAVNIIGKD